MSIIHFSQIILSCSSALFLLQRSAFAELDISSNSSLKLPCALLECRNISDNTYDAVIFIAVELQSALKLVPDLKPVLEHRVKVDSVIFDVKGVSLIGVDKSIIPSGRLILSTTGPLDRDFDDVRQYKDAAFKAVKLAKSRKFRRLLLIVDNTSKYTNAKIVSVLGAMQALYIPLQIQEFESLNELDLQETVLGVWFPASADRTRVDDFLTYISAVESGKVVARDIITGDPERLAPPRVADYIENEFGNSSTITVEVIVDQSEIESNYPLVAAVSRAASNLPRHHARIVKLTYAPSHCSAVGKTLLFVGKGVTLDTGGMDIKSNGHMIGMSEDKAGAAIVAGFFKALDILQPTNLRARAILPLVRNSIGPNGFSCDELLVTKSGRRVRITNTDSEGRMVMADPLYELAQLAQNYRDPHLFTVATLTGHAFVTVGKGYSISIDNGPARAANFSRDLALSSEAVGEIIESSTLRREDYEYHKYSDMEYEDLKQSNIGPSAQTARGHMLPVAFMIMASGLDKHGLNSKLPLKYTHLDIAAAEPSYPQVPWANPLTSLINNLIRPSLYEEI